jgi:hypothetical protein
LVVFSVSSRESCASLRSSDGGAQSLFRVLGHVSIFHGRLIILLRCLHLLLVIIGFFEARGFLIFFLLFVAFDCAWDGWMGHDQQLSKLVVVQRFGSEIPNLNTVDQLAHWLENSNKLSEVDVYSVISKTLGFIAHYGTPLIHHSLCVVAADHDT